MGKEGFHKNSDSSGTVRIKTWHTSTAGNVSGIEAFTQLQQKFNKIAV
jgi:hypothetical protein